MIRSLLEIQKSTGYHPASHCLFSNAAVFPVLCSGRTEAVCKMEVMMTRPRGSTLLKKTMLLLTTGAFLLFFPVLSPALDETDVIYGPERVSEGGWEETPRVVTDSAGNAHIVWAAHDRLMYKMVGRDGSVSIEETNLIPSTETLTTHVRCPSVAIDGEDALHIVFHGDSLYTGFGESGYTGLKVLSSSEVIYLKVNPAPAAKDGNPADPYAVTVIPETIVSTDDGVPSIASDIAFDPFNDRLYVSWWDGAHNRESMDIHARVLDLHGNQAAAETVVSSGRVVDTEWGGPRIACDHQGNAHIVYFAVTDGAGIGDNNRREIFYTMINAEDGSIETVIDDIAVSAPDGSASVRPHVAVDRENNVHIMWHDARYVDEGSGEHEIFYSRLDVSRYYPGGDPENIKVISEVPVTGNDGWESYLSHLAVDDCGRVHVTWADQRDGYYQEVYYKVFSPGDRGGITMLTGDIRLTYTGETLYPAEWLNCSVRNPVAAVGGGRVFVAFHARESVNFQDYNIYLAVLPGSEELSFQIPGGADVKNYRMVSFPGYPDSSCPVETFEQSLGGYDDSRWRLFAYNHDTGDYDEAHAPDFSELYPAHRGVVYWLISRDSATINAQGYRTPALPVELHLDPGWNMVANPYPYEMDFYNTSIKVSANGVDFLDICDPETNNLTESFLRRFAPDEMAEETDWYRKMALNHDNAQAPYGPMKPYEGYWLLNTSGDRLIVRFEPREEPLLPTVTLRLPFYQRPLYALGRQVNRILDSVTSCYASEVSSEPPPPPSASGRSSGSIGVSAGGGGGCFVHDLMPGRFLNPRFLFPALVFLCLVVTGFGIGRRAGSGKEF